MNPPLIFHLHARVKRLGHEALSPENIGMGRGLFLYGYIHERRTGMVTKKPKQGLESPVLVVTKVVDGFGMKLETKTG